MMLPFFAERLKHEMMAAIKHISPFFAHHFSTKTAKHKKYDVGIAELSSATTFPILEASEVQLYHFLDSIGYWEFQFPVLHISHATDCVMKFEFSLIFSYVYCASLRLLFPLRAYLWALNPLKAPKILKSQRKLKVILRRPKHFHSLPPDSPQVAFSHRKLWRNQMWYASAGQKRRKRDANRDEISWGVETRFGQFWSLKWDKASV
jgi:hypothetical protein